MALPAEFDAEDEHERSKRSASFMQSFNEAFRGGPVQKQSLTSSGFPAEAPAGLSSDSPGRRKTSPNLWMRPADMSGLSQLQGLDRLTQLQAELAEERKARQERAAALNLFHNTARSLREELLEETEPLEQAEAELAIVAARSDAELRRLEELTEQHYALLSKKATLEAEIRRHTVASWTEELRLRQQRRDREWARDGPETDALKDAKVHLAETMGLLDEARLQQKSGLKTLQREVENAEAENLGLRQTLENFPTPSPSRSIVQSMWQMLTSGVNGDGGSGQVVRT